MHSLATLSEKAIRQPVFVIRRTSSGPRLLRRFQTFIESTDWERRYLCNRLIDRVCLGVILLAVLYFTPVLASAFWK
jgi:hypothetical protein